MFSDAWWLSLQELSQPEWRTSSVMQISSASLESIAEGFRASGVRLWQIKSPGLILIVAQWPQDGANGYSDTRADLKASTQTFVTPELVRIIELAVAHQKPLWIEGQPPLNDSDAVTQPLDQPRLVFAASDVSEPAFVLELIFSDDRHAITSVDRECYLKAGLRLASTLSFETIQKLAQGIAIDRVPSQNDFAPRLLNLTELLQRRRYETIAMIELEFVNLEGINLGELKENQRLASQIHLLLDAQGLRVRCPHCGQPAIIRCLAVGNSASGSFVFDHYLEDGRTFHGGRTALPRLTVVAKPSRRSLKQKSL